MFCINSECSKIQSTLPETCYYRVLYPNITRAVDLYDLDKRRLKQKFLDLQQKSHPDSWSMADTRERQMAEDLSVWLNKAHSTLKDPLNRLKYIISLAEPNAQEDAEAQTTVDPDLLMEVMSIREEISDAKSQLELDAVFDKISDRIAMITKDISKSKPTKKGTKEAAPSSASGQQPDKTDVASLKEELKKEVQDRNLFQLERGKIQDFWDITKSQLQSAKVDLLKKDREYEESEETHRDEVKSYKQNVKHLLFEYQTGLTNTKLDSEREIDLIREELKLSDDGLKKQNRSLKVELKELELSNHEIVKNLKLKHEQEVVLLSTSFDQRCRDLYNRYADKTKNLRDELEIKRKTEVHELEERKNNQINSLIRSHEKSFAEMKNYYNDITLNNLALINSLKEQLEELSKSEERNEKSLNEITAENKRLKEPLEVALVNGESLKKQLKNYEKDKIMLKQTKLRLKELEEQTKRLTWEKEVLNQKYLLTEKERNELYQEFSAKCRDIEQKVGLKGLVLEKKINSYRSELDSKDLQIKEIVSEISKNPRGFNDAQLFQAISKSSKDTVADKNSLAMSLYKELVKVIKIHNASVEAVRDANTTAKFLPGVHLLPIKVPAIWPSLEASSSDEAVSQEVSTGTEALSEEAQEHRGTQIES